jgi:cytochrome c
MQSRSVIAALSLIAALGAAAPAAAQSSPTMRGEAIAQKHCARCHAIGRTGASPMGLAPPFRELSKRYPIETLEEALAEGIVVGHPAMPRFTFEPRDINALLSYISGLTDREPARKKSPWQRSLDLRQSRLTIFQASFAGSVPRQQRSAAFGPGPH